jgi:hypothetical protein
VGRRNSQSGDSDDGRLDDDHADRQKADRAMQAMMKMQKIVIADLEKAYAG